MKPSTRRISDMPIGVACRGVALIWKMEQRFNEFEKSTSDCFVAERMEGQGKVAGGYPKPSHFAADGLDVRNRFMELKTAQEFLAFLNGFGAFTSSLVEDLIRDVFLSELIICQKIFRDLALRSPASWDDYLNGLQEFPLHSFIWMVHFGVLNERRISFDWDAKRQKSRKGPPYLAMIETTNIFDAILATIQIDHSRGVELRACKKFDCPDWYEVTSKHKRLYCSEPCAHHESVRKSRRNAKRAGAKITGPKVRSKKLR